MNKLSALFVTLFLLAGALGYAAETVTNPPTHTTGAVLPSATAVFETSLQSAVTSSATTMTLTANAVRGGGTISGYNCFTVDEGSAQAETMCGTVSGTTVSSLSRGISQSTGTTTVAALQFAHRRGANVKITDFPIIQIMKAQLNGEDTIPNLLSYTYSPNFTGYASSAIASKGYVDGVAVAGASNADDTTKGIVETATAAEAAAGTSLGGTGARLAIPASICSSTASANTLCVITSAAGKIAQGFLDLTQTYTWTGLHLFSQASSTRFSVFDTLYVGGSATSTLQGTTSGTSTIQGFLNVSGTNSTSTFSGNLRVSATSSMAGCTGCLSGYERVTNTGAGPTTAGTLASVTATCTTGKKVIGGGSSDSGSSAYANMQESYPSAANTWTVTYASYAGGASAANTITAYALCVYP